MVYGQGPILWEDITHTSVILTDLFCHETNCVMTILHYSITLALLVRFNYLI